MKSIPSSVFFYSIFTSFIGPKLTWEVLKTPIIVGSLSFRSLLVRVPTLKWSLSTSRLLMRECFPELSWNSKVTISSSIESILTTWFKCDKQISLLNLTYSPVSSWTRWGLSFQKLRCDLKVIVFSPYLSASSYSGVLRSITNSDYDSLLIRTSSKLKISAPASLRWFGN